MEEMFWQLQSGGGVMIAANEHHLQPWAFRQSFAHELVEALLRGNRRIHRVVDVARDDERIRILREQLVGKPIEEGVMFDAAIESVQFLSEMPVRRMDDTHRPHLLYNGACYGMHDVTILTPNRTGNKTGYIGELRISFRHVSAL